MKRIFISQPMRGKTDEAIKSIREAALEVLNDAFMKEDYEVIDTLFTDFNGNRLEFLGKSITEGLARADIAVFLDDWERYDGCRCEQFIAAQYNIPCIYFSNAHNDRINGGIS